MLGLYPVVMLQTLLFHELDLMQDWPLPGSMLVNNLISSSILTWVVMPNLTRLLGFWLQPVHQELPLRRELIGLGLLLLGLGAMVCGFGLA